MTFLSDPEMGKYVGRVEGIEKILWTKFQMAAEACSFYTTYFLKISKLKDKKR